MYASIFRSTNVAWALAQTLRTINHHLCKRYVSGSKGLVLRFSVPTRFEKSSIQMSFQKRIFIPSINYFHWCLRTRYWSNPVNRFARLMFEDLGFSGMFCFFRSQKQTIWPSAIPYLFLWSIFLNCCCLFNWAREIARSCYVSPVHLTYEYVNLDSFNIVCGQNTASHF